MDISKPEVDLNSALKNACHLINPKKGPIFSLYRNPQYNDGPRFFQYTALIKKTSIFSDVKEDAEELAGGMAFSKKKAVMKALGEAIERYSLAIFRKKQFIYSSSQELKKTKLDPLSVINFSSKQLHDKQHKHFKLNKNMKLWWVKGYSLTQKESTLIPAQLIYVPYHFCKEPAIRFPITTGAATGSSLGGAILRGICEVAERDSFMIFYLNKLIPIRIDLTNSRDKTLRLISGNFKRYNLELYVFDISTDIPTVSIMAIIIDKTGIGPAVAVGLNSSLSPKDAILGAIEEAQHTRPWMRDEMFKRSKSSQSKFIVDLLERGLLWAKLDKVRHLDFFLNSKKLVGVDQFIITKSKKVAKDVKSFIEWFKNNNLEVVFADVTQPEIKKQGFFVVKVVIPKLQPLYLIEKFKYLGGERLYQIPKTLGFTKSITSEEKLNKLPHPFL